MAMIAFKILLIVGARTLVNMTFLCPSYVPKTRREKRFIEIPTFESIQYLAKYSLTGLA